ncbi:MAG: selenocysteine-specific translation elongation factor, partial [Aggregatilineales bacterium]
MVGTAGHVDHGKSTLVRALTGIDPDRLKEEQARQMTIDLGFAHFTLPDGQVVSLIDVPGHRDFIENMLAGVGGIDAALFVVAADEGAMPQTREHLAILDLLRIPAGVVALTKADLIDDPDWFDLLRLDLSELFAGTILENAPIVPVSALLGTGLDVLQVALSTALASALPRPDHGTPRLWLDRVFTISGFGTVATGTLLDGQLTIGQEVELQPSGLRARIRGLQAHGQPTEIALPGSRTAVNLAGVSRQDIRRGDLLTLPGLVQPTTLIDVSYRHLPTAARPLKHNAQVKLFCGSAERLARLRVLAADALKPGESGWLQLHVTEPLPVTKGDRFILRVPSPSETIGGGIVIDPQPGMRWRRFRPELIARFETLARGDPAALIRDAIDFAPSSISQLA